MTVMKRGNTVKQGNTVELKNEQDRRARKTLNSSEIKLEISEQNQKRHGSSGEGVGC